MIHFDPPPEPEYFDEKVRTPGQRWLVTHLDDRRLPDYWKYCREDLAKGFYDLCGYLAVYLPYGTVDHYISINTNRNLAYEWSNYRYVTGSINSTKQTLDQDVLDPFEVQNDWFEVLLPSCELVMTDAIPESRQECADYTLKKLHLGRSEKAIRLRRKYYEMYKDEKITLEGLDELAPLIARAIRKQEQE